MPVQPVHVASPAIEAARMSVILVRHAESSGQDPEASLTLRGVREAKDLASALHDLSIDQVASSPYRRARQTAELLAVRGTPKIDERLAEWEVPWVPDNEWPHALRSILAGDVELPHGVESRDAAIARGLASFRDVARDGPVVSALVTHGKLLALLLSALGGGDPFDIFTTLHNPHAFEVRAAGTMCEVRSLWHPDTAAAAARLRQRPSAQR